VGSFRVAARLLAPSAGAPSAHTVGISITPQGEGDCSLFSAPTADDLRPVHLLGVRDDRERALRVMLLDLAPAPRAQTFPPLTFAWYEPGRGYVGAATEPLVLPAVEGAADPSLGSGVAPEAPAPPPPDRGPLPWLGAVVLLLLGIFLPLPWRRRSVPAAAPRSHDHGALRARLAAPGADLASAFQALLAARLGAPESAVIAPDLAARLERAGASPDAARDGAAALEALVAARYGAPGPAPSRDTLLALADRLLAGRDTA
jgi:hypothetical protein